MSARAIAVAALAMVATTAAAGPKAEPPPKVATKAQRPEAGDRRRIIGILDVHLDGVPKEIAKQFQVNLEAKLDSRAYWLAPQQRVHDSLANSTKWTDGCVVGPCLSEVRVQTGAEVVLLASITGSGTSFGYVVTLVSTETGRYVAQETNRCDVCTVNEALSSATLAAVKLVTSLPDRLPDEQAEQKASFALTKSNLELANEQAKSRHRTAGFIATLAGVVVAGIGVTVYVLDNHPRGMATAMAGAGLTVGGVVALTF